jgi:uncharacterized protein YndB with AHSA1/START domain
VGAVWREVNIVAKLTKSITINVPPEKVFAYVNEPANLVEVWPSFEEAKDVRPTPNGGHSFRWVYKMAGMRLEGTSEDTEVVANQRHVSRTQGGIESTVTWTFRREDGSTRVTFETDYTVPIPLLGKLAETFIVRANEHEAETILANLKDRMED